MKNNVGEIRGGGLIGNRPRNSQKAEVGSTANRCTAAKRQKRNIKDFGKRKRFQE